MANGKPHDDWKTDLAARPNSGMPGIDLAEAFYRDVVASIVGGTPHSAALLGWGSDVLGYDTEQSTDHGWGPRLQVFVDQADVASVAARIEERLPVRFGGWPTRFGWDATPVTHHVEVVRPREWLRARLGVDPTEGLTHRDWLLVPQQLLLEVTAGRVFHDGLALLGPVRQTLQWYPTPVWLWLIACQWRRISHEEAFVGRAAQVGDDLGSRIVTARVARDIMRLCFLIERRYAPYSKWLGTAFTSLDAAADVGRGLARALAATGVQGRQAGLVAAYEAVARRFNDLRLTPGVDPSARPFYDRPFLVIGGERFAEACLAALDDQWLRSLPLVGSVDQFVDSTDLLAHGERCFLLGAIYGV